ncbi:hypothetical protein AB6A40_000459 [Gnathostoma spinigerum]|uniref:Uncharacterized protein n=1 Tax=Gnathostoma spinigerum TaxID=75299 RepID=A0ABD6E330_9BILA
MFVLFLATILIATIVNRVTSTECFFRALDPDSETGYSYLPHECPPAPANDKMLCVSKVYKNPEDGRDNVENQCLSSLSVQAVLDREDDRFPDGCLDFNEDFNGWLCYCRGHRCNTPKYVKQLFAEKMREIHRQNQ